MNTRTRRTALTTLSCVALAIGACSGPPSAASAPSALTVNGASEQTAANPGLRGHGPMDPARFVQRFDRNGNGALEVSELPDGMQQRFGAADTNHDGVLAADEMTAFHAAREAEHFAQMDGNHDGALTQDEVGERWAHLGAADADHDGRVTAAELQAARVAGTLRPQHGFGGRHGGPGFGPRGPMNPAMVIQHFDRDGNGTLEVSELPERMREHFGSADANHDGVISADEIAAKEQAMRAERFGRIDTNHDGVVTADEVGAERWTHLGAADANADGRVSADELDTAFRSGAMRPQLAPRPAFDADDTNE